LFLFAELTDREIGRVVQAVDDMGVKDNTLIIWLLRSRNPGREAVFALAIYLNSQAVSVGFCGGACWPFLLNSTTQLPERAIRCHESCQHRRDKQRWVCSRLSAFPFQDFRIGRQIAIDHYRKLYGQADGLVIFDRANL
jgi:hypothetical protein